MGSIFLKDTMVLAGIEATAGAGAVLTGISAIEVSDVSIEPLKSDKKSRNIVKPWAGISPSKQANTHRTCKLKCDFAGGGGVLGDVMPAWGVLHRMCQMTATVDSTVGAEKVTFVGNHPSSQVTGALHYYLDQELRKLYGAQGKVSLEFKAGEIPKWVYDFTGLWSAPLIQAPPAPVYTQWKDPDVVSDDYTPTFQLDGVDLVLEDLSIDFGQKVTFKNRPNQAAVKTPDRETTGNATFLYPGLAVLDVELLAKEGTLIPLALAHGTATGRKLLIDAAFVQITDFSFTDLDGEVACKVGLNFTNPDGTGDWTITAQ